MQERATAIETKLLFFDLEWALDDDRADELLAADGLDTSRHYLRTLRRYRPHLLTEPEEKIAAEGADGRDAWTRLFSELTSAIRVELPDEPEPVMTEVALSRLLSPDRDVRAAAAEAVTAALTPGLRTGPTSSTRCCRTRRSRTVCATTCRGWPAATSPTRSATRPCRRSSTR